LATVNPVTKKYGARMTWKINLIITTKRVVLGEGGRKKEAEKEKEEKRNANQEANPEANPEANHEANQEANQEVNHPTKSLPE
jgi:hypothetical protein